MKENGIDIPQQVSDILDTLRNQGKASILAAADGLCVGVLGLSDVLCSMANEMVAELDEMGSRRRCRTLYNCNRRVSLFV